MTQHNVTMAEMALRLGVSNATVANALSGRGRVSAEVTARVKALARELNYVPNTAARMLRTNVKDTVGVVITLDIVNPWYSQLLSLLETELSRHGLSMLLIIGKGDVKKVRKALLNFMGGRICGIIAGPIVRHEDLAFIQLAMDYQVPVVAFNSLEELPLNQVNIDLVCGAQEAVEHLVGLGHRRIMFFGCPEQSSDEHISGTRYDGYIRGMTSHGLSVDVFPARHGICRKEGYELGQALLRERLHDDFPTALFCHNDEMALGAILALLLGGLRVPEDISVVGFDDIEESAYAYPPLTTMGGVMHELAVQLVELVRGCEETGGDVQKRKIMPKLVVRSSSK